MSKVVKSSTKKYELDLTDEECAKAMALTGTSNPSDAIEQIIFMMAQESIDVEPTNVKLYLSKLKAP